MSTTETSPKWEPVLPLIAILRGIRPEDALAHVTTLIGMGFEAIEIPLNSPDWETSLKVVLGRFGERTWIGGGTVLETSQVDRLKALGARLAVAPNTCPTLIRHAVLQGLTVIPGVATPTEAFEALGAKAQALKIFPAGSLGPGFVRALRAVLPPAPLYAVGGVTPENLAAYLDAGCVGAGLGTQLYQPDQPLSRTEAMAKEYLEAFRETKRQQGVP